MPVSELNAQPMTPFMPVLRCVSEASTRGKGKGDCRCSIRQSPLVSHANDLQPQWHTPHGALGLDLK